MNKKDLQIMEILAQNCRIPNTTIAKALNISKDTVAYKIKLLDSYIPKLRNGKSVLLDSTLWATKYNGCAVTKHEIEEIKQYLLTL